MPGKRNPKKKVLPESSEPQFEPIPGTSTDLDDSEPQPTLPSLDTQPETDDDAHPVAPKRKKYRQSKKEIPEYNWTREANITLGEFVKEHEQLYDKKAREWLNVESKNRLWAQAGEQLTPPATAAQCKKQYENMRTRVGKLLRKESKSGSGQPERSKRDEDLLEAWGFLQSHISRGPTQSTEEFPQASQASYQPPQPDQPYSEDELSVGGISSHGGQDVLPVLGKGKGKGKVSRRPSSSTELAYPNTALASVVDTTPDQCFELRDAVLKIMSSAERPGPSGSLTVHEQIIKHFSALFETHMRRIPEAAWHHFQIDALNLVARYTTPSQPSQQAYTNMLPTYPHVYQPPIHHQPLVHHQPPAHHQLPVHHQPPVRHQPALYQPPSVPSPDHQPDQPVPTSVYQPACTVPSSSGTSSWTAPPSWSSSLTPPTSLLTQLTSPAPPPLMAYPHPHHLLLLLCSSRPRQVPLRVHSLWQASRGAFHPHW